jgi:hypothetical protein
MVEATALHWTFKFFDAVVKHVQEQVGGEPYSGNGLMFLFSMEDHYFNSKQNDRRYSQIMKVHIEHEGSQSMKVLSEYEGTQSTKELRDEGMYIRAEPGGMKDELLIDIERKSHQGSLNEVQMTSVY